jgi:hypothetical protein
MRAVLFRWELFPMGVFAVLMSCVMLPISSMAMFGLYVGHDGLHHLRLHRRAHAPRAAIVRAWPIEEPTW